MISTQNKQHLAHFSATDFDPQKAFDTVMSEVYSEVAALRLDNRASDIVQISHHITEALNGQFLASVIVAFGGDADG